MSGQGHLSWTLAHSGSWDSGALASGRSSVPGSQAQATQGAI